MTSVPFRHVHLLPPRLDESEDTVGDPSIVFTPAVADPRNPWRIETQLPRLEAGINLLIPLLPTNPFLQDPGGGGDNIYS